jgi:hypothetical protein
VGLIPSCTGHAISAVVEQRLASRLISSSNRFKFDHVTSLELTEIHQALAAVQQTVGTLTFPRCDQDDVFELIERVEAELQSVHPNLRLIATFLNSIARSLRAQPEAREACLVIEDAIEHAGIPSTWQTGI